MSLDNLTPQALRTLNIGVHQDSTECTRTNRDLVLSKYPAPCEECRRLNKVYLGAIERNNEAASAMASFYAERWQDTWHEEMKQLREACEKALEALDQHRREHGW
jgi:hypothetical protein